MPTTSADVPGLYDLVVAVSGGNTTGFLLNDSLESSIPFRTHRAIYTYTPTFIERQNVSGDFGDNQQSFFLTAAQRDWSLGEQQRYFHQSDGDSVRRYYGGAGGGGLDPTKVPGQVSIRSAVDTRSAADAIGAAAASDSVGGGSARYFTATTNLYKQDGTGVTITDLGAHGVGSSPRAMAADATYVYMSIGGSKVRKWKPSAFTDFSATGSDALCFLNNTLFGYRSTTGDLIRYDTAGAVTSLFTWKDATGGAVVGTVVLRPFGGKLLILRSSLPDSGGAELWLYDGTAPSKIAEFPSHFTAWQLEVAQGVAYVSGTYGALSTEPVIYAYASGSLSILWRSAASGGAAPGMAPYENGLAFGHGFLLYDSREGGIHSLGAGTTATKSLLVAAGGALSSYQYLGTGVNTYPASSTASAATLSTSLFDFDSSLTKVFRSIAVEFVADTSGNGGTVDVSYQVDNVDGSYTSLASGVTSGAENLFGSSVTGKRISVQVNLNKGTSTNGPVLKRISVRAAPLLTRYRQQEYILNCAGDPSTEDAMALRDDGNSTHPLSGRQQVNELRLAAASQTPLTLTDRFGNYTGIIETLEAYEQHPSNADPSRSGSFLVKLGTREV